MSKTFVQFIGYCIFVLIMQDLFIDLLGPTGDTIATIVTIVAVAAGYLTWIYASRDRAKYPSTVRNRLREGLERGATKR